ncbi:gamma-glutamyltransferase family protein [Celerinatantimonas sp. YJH-8]|uniref:gamma-glutamyltransferase family protein n=1 Tax=Celerinatantimonas sp. YJH-8 TaxID=3228714 RepID=UPI0038C4D218
MQNQLNYACGYASFRAPIMGKNAVATSQPLAAQAGLKMLALGGTAADAAVAAAMTLTVVEPTGNGIGSDAFAIIWDGHQLSALNASGRSPAAWTPEYFKEYTQMPETGWDSVTVPGAVSGWIALHQKYGKLPLSTVAEPAIRYAEQGFVVTPLIARLWAKGVQKHGHQPGFKEAFTIDGHAPKAGELFKHPEQARTLRLIAETAGNAFYRGELAQQMVACSHERGGALTLEDLANHQPQWLETLSVPFVGGSVHELPPNGQGIATLIALGILKQLHIEQYAVDSAISHHLCIEAMKLALADLDQHVSDLEHMRVKPEALLDDEYLKARAALIDPNKAGDFTYGEPQPGGTVYISCADEQGMMVSFIQSNYMGFGSGVVVPGTGISLQNRGCGFVLEPGHVNQVGPNKRPLHTIIPAFALDAQGQPLLSFGVMGGPMQAQGHLQMALRIMVHRQNPQAAIDAPRWKVVKGRHVTVEPTMDRNVIAALRAMGHQIEISDPFDSYDYGGAQAIYRHPDGHYIAASESRKDGQAVAF